MPRFALLIAGIVALCALATWWLVTEHTATERPTPRESAPAERDPSDPDAVGDAVEDNLKRQTTGPQIIERERVAEGDDDDDSGRPDVRVIVPSTAPTRPQSTPTPASTTRPPIVRDIEIPELPDLPATPEVPVVPLP